MNDLQREVLNRVIGGTANIVDRHKTLAALAYAKGHNIESDCKQMILQSRLDWLNWQTRTQRQWQKHTRNPNKAMHHDSIEIRERYVRCSSGAVTS